METEGWGCQARDSRAFYHLLGAFWVELTEGERDRETERQRQRQRQRRTEHATDQKDQTRPALGGRAWGQKGVRVEGGPTPRAASASSTPPTFQSSAHPPRRTVTT